MKKYNLISIVFRILAGVMGLIFVVSVWDCMVHFYDRSTNQFGFILGGLAIGPLFLEYAIKGKLSLRSYNKKFFSK